MKKLLLLVLLASILIGCKKVEKEPQYHVYIQPEMGLCFDTSDVDSIEVKDIWTQGCLEEHYVQD